MDLWGADCICGITCETSHTHIHTHTTILPLSEFCPGQPGGASTRSNIYPLNLSWSSVIPYLLPVSILIHGILPVQFTTCVAVFFHTLSKFSLAYLLAWHPQIHTPYNNIIPEGTTIFCLVSFTTGTVWSATSSNSSASCCLMYCGETVRPSEKLSEGVNGKSGSKS